MQNETQNQDTNTQDIAQEEFRAQNETPQNQDIDPAVTMSWDDLVGSDPNVTMHPEDLFDPETTELIEVDPSAEEGPMNYIQPYVEGQLIEVDPSAEEGPMNYIQPYVGDQQYELIEVDSSEPVITDWDLGRPSEPVTIDLAAPSAEDAWDTVSGWF